jgi:hypothetical protein
MTPPPTGDGMAADVEQTSRLWLDGSADAEKKPQSSKSRKKKKTPKASAQVFPTRVMAEMKGSGPYGLAGPLQMPWTLLYPAIDRVWKNDAETAAKVLHPWPSKFRFGELLYPDDPKDDANENT